MRWAFNCLLKILKQWKIFFSKKRLLTKPLHRRRYPVNLADRFVRRAAKGSECLRRTAATCGSSASWSPRRLLSWRRAESGRNRRWRLSWRACTGIVGRDSSSDSRQISAKSAGDRRRGAERQFLENWQKLGEKHFSSVSVIWFNFFPIFWNFFFFLIVNLRKILKNQIRKFLEFLGFFCLKILTVKLI